LSTQQNHVHQIHGKKKKKKKNPTKFSDSRFACITIAYYYYYYHRLNLHVSALSWRKQVNVMYKTPASTVIRNCSSVFSLMIALKGQKHVGDDNCVDDDNKQENNNNVMVIHAN
jgi:hypothetical protein